jgi:hypothetical protein
MENVAVINLRQSRCDVGLLSSFNKTIIPYRIESAYYMFNSQCCKR